MSESIADVARSALAEAGRVVDRLDAAAFEAFAQAIVGAKRIALHGLGREGLQMKGLAMRLYHLRLDAHVVGGMTTPPIGAGPADRVGRPRRFRHHHRARHTNLE